VISEWLLSGISLNKSRDSMESVDCPNKIREHQSHYHTWIETNAKHLNEPVSRLRKRIQQAPSRASDSADKTTVRNNPFAAKSFWVQLHSEHGNSNVFFSHADVDTECSGSG
jgi:hypothetical protein